MPVRRLPESMERMRFMMRGEGEVGREGRNCIAFRLFLLPR